MNDDILSIDFTRTLPPALKNDPNMFALATVISQQLHNNMNTIDSNVIYARIDVLPEWVLDVLAYDLKVDWYDYTYPVEVKRATIKDSVKVHRKLGTKYAVQTALGNVFPGTKIEEWFEYNGDPFMFRIIIDATTAGISEERQAEILERVKFYKNARSHLESINYKIEKATTVQLAAVHSVGGYMQIYPFLTHEISTSGGPLCGGVLHYANKIVILPYLTTKIESKFTVKYGGFTQYGNTLAVYPQQITEV